MTHFRPIHFVVLLHVLLLWCAEPALGHYRPGTGRWLERDPLLFHDGMNTYSYARAAPVRLSDPQGLAASSCSSDEKGRCRCKILSQAVTSPALRADQIEVLKEAIKIFDDFELLTDIAGLGSAGGRLLVEGTEALEDAACEALDVAGGSVDVDWDTLIDAHNISSAAMWGAVRIWTKVDRECCSCSTGKKWGAIPIGTVTVPISIGGGTATIPFALPWRVPCETCTWKMECNHKWVPCSRPRATINDSVSEFFSLSEAAEMLSECARHAADWCASNRGEIGDPPMLDPVLPDYPGDDNGFQPPLMPD